MLWCLRYDNDKQLRNIVLETDSLNLQKIIREVWDIPWLIKKKVEEIKKHIESIQVEISHIYKEANQLDDSLANHALI